MRGIRFMAFCKRESVSLDGLAILGTGFGIGMDAKAENLIQEQGKRLSGARGLPILVSVLDVRGYMHYILEPVLGGSGVTLDLSRCISKFSGSSRHINDYHRMMILLNRGEPYYLL
ncbi:hypothetical protein AG1IA_01645 [Rhizoctonia solani AG-1 IA]|uniref:Uncharacterized protein n=1 Tax=Thanatephorus cucumeris (strain AG1-IA) TaxID=983506 RepID=L8X5G3_THACA|nr:hypothetical protein AG1IA_01645 [Rhizoctonia solani AG-1 IA]